jgi:hypothetical protein
MEFTEMHASTTLSPLYQLALPCPHMYKENVYVYHITGLWLSDMQVILDNREV